MQVRKETREGCKDESVGVSVCECVCVCVCERERARERTGGRQAYRGVMQRDRKGSSDGKRQHRGSIGMWRE